MPAYKPENYNSVSPYLIVKDAGKTLQFLQDVFDAAILRTYQAEQGSYLHAEAKVDDTIIMLADAAPGWPAISCHVHIYVPDVDSSFARALRHGATAVQSPIQKDDADKRGGFSDEGGTTWWIATQQ